MNTIPVTFGNEIFNLTEEQVNCMKRALGINRRRLSEVAIGDTFKVTGIEFIKFTEEAGEAIAVSKDILFNEKFDDNTNNFAKSYLLKKLVKEFLPKIADAIGNENVLKFDTDLTSLDGLDDYGTVSSKISLPTFDFYRKHVKIFDKYKANKWWWLSTPDSTPTHGCGFDVRCVNDRGSLYGDICYDTIGVRPFCIFKSLIFVS